MVSDSFGPENEVDKSKSSEEKTSATGSKVAPRSMGSEFSPMEKAKKAQREVYPFYMSGAIQDGQNHSCKSLGSKKCWCCFRVQREGKVPTINQATCNTLASVTSQNSTVPLPFSSPGRGFLVVSAKRTTSSLPLKPRYNEK